MDLKQQQEDINRRLAELQGNPTPIDNTNDSQDMLIQQLRNALGNKKEEDPNKALLRALVNPQNKTSAPGGANTLKPNVLSGLLTAEGGNSMAKWLGSLNKQEEGESEL